MKKNTGAAQVYKRLVMLIYNINFKYLNIHIKIKRAQSVVCIHSIIIYYSFKNCLRNIYDSNN